MAVRTAVQRLKPARRSITSVGDKVMALSEGNYTPSR